MPIATCTVMTYADGQGESRYVVFVGPMNRAKTVFYSNRARMVAGYTLRGERPDYHAMTAAHATAAAPAVPWQA